VPGSYAIATTATDDDGGVVRDTRLVVIANLPPVIAPASPGPVAEGALFSFTGSFTDLSGAEDGWTGTVRFDGGPAQPLRVNADGTFTLETVFAHDSPHTAVVTVTDRFGGSDTETFGVEVENVAPVVAAGADLTLAVGTAFTRTITFTDPGADAWTAQVDFGDGVQQTFGALAQRRFDITHTYTSRAVNTVTVTVSDGAATGSDQFVVSPPNVAPVLNGLPGQRVVLTHPLQVTVSATDLDVPPQTLTFSLGPGVPSGAAIDPVTGLFSWAPSLLVNPGVHPVTVRVTDNGTPALFAEDTFNVTVLPNLDVDGNGTANATDGQIILRYLSGAPNGQLLTGVTLGAGATRTTTTAIRTYLDSGKALSPKMLDADGNGQFGALTDGRLISRYLSGITGPALVGGSVLGAGATRTTADAIATYLSGFMPVVPVRSASAEGGLKSATAAVVTAESGSSAPASVASSPSTDTSPTTPTKSADGSSAPLTTEATPSSLAQPGSPAPSTPVAPASATPLPPSMPTPTEHGTPLPSQLLAFAADADLPAVRPGAFSSPTFFGTTRFASTVGDRVARGGAGNDPLFGEAGTDVRSGGEGDDLLLGGPGQKLFIDWSRPWEGWRTGHQPGKEFKSAWLKPFLLDLAEDDPNLGIQVVLVDHALAAGPVNGKSGHTSGRSR